MTYIVHPKYADKCMCRIVPDLESLRYWVLEWNPACTTHPKVLPPPPKRPSRAICNACGVLLRCPCCGTPL